MTYAEQLKHPNWQRRRLEVLENADFSCENCGVKDKTLHVHHRRYLKGLMVWEYDDEDLACLCDGCHADLHDKKTLSTDLLAKYGHHDEVIGYIYGLVASYRHSAVLGVDAKGVLTNHERVVGFVDATIELYGTKVEDVIKALRAGNPKIAEIIAMTDQM